MSNTNLVKYFKSSPLITDIGEFSFIEQIGQGGNAIVCSFKKSDGEFAVKFIEHEDKSKLARFVDEYFCCSQLSTHQNIARNYHFDTVEVEGSEYSLIIMKRYEFSLKKQKSISLDSEEEKASKGWMLAHALTNGLLHLHRNGIIHRDIKPENIFFDASADTFVIGDLGIAHFSEDFVREAQTRTGERLANYAFSPPDQINPKGHPHPAWDIYALGQVLSWYLYDITIRGDGREQYNGQNSELAILDAVIHRCVQNDPFRRFQSIEELNQFVKTSRTPNRDIFQRLNDLDEAFRSSIPKIDEFYETTDQHEINRFLTNFSQQCHLDEFWYITSSGGDNTLHVFSHLENDRWLLSGSNELKVEKLICYKDVSVYKSLFVLVTAADEPFLLTDFDGNVIQRGDLSKWTSDEASLFDNQYMNSTEFKNGYYEHNGHVHRVDYARVNERIRTLRPDTFMIVPDRTGPSRVDWAVNRDFLTKIAQKRTVSKEDLNAYLQITRKYCAQEITIRL